MQSRPSVGSISQRLEEAKLAKDLRDQETQAMAEEYGVDPAIVPKS